MKVDMLYQNVNLVQLISSGSVVFLDDRIIPIPKGSEYYLQPMFNTVHGALQQWSQNEHEVMVILDDIAILEWIGFSAEDVSRFVRALGAACRKVSRIRLMNFE